MSKLTQKIVSVSVSVATAVSLSGFAAFVPTAQAAALTSGQVSAIVSLLQSFGADAATISNVQASLTGTAPVSVPTGSSSSHTFTKDLTVGSKGAEVMALQNVLIKGGYLKITAATDAFGPMTKAAVIAWQKAAGISPASGLVGPKSRQALNSMGGSVGTPVVQTGAPMSISLASDSPMAQSVAPGAVNAPVTKLNFTAGANPVTVTAITLTRSGLSQDSDLNNVYLYDGSMKLASNLGFNNGRVNFSNSTGLFTVPANTTKTITVTVDVYASASAGRIISFGIASAADVTGGTFSGSFPITGASFTVASVLNLAQLRIDGYSSSSVSVNAGQTNYLVGQFNIQASNNPAKVTYLRLQNVGSVSASDLRNIKLMQGSTQLGATVAVLDSSNALIFDLSNAPLMLTSGQTAVLSLYADISGGVNRTFQFSIQQSADIKGVDTMYGVGIGATLVSGSFPVQFYAGNIQNGGVVLSKSSSSPSTYAVAGNTNQVFAKFDVLASGDSIRFNQVDFVIGGTGQSISNFRVVDDQGVQIGTTQNIGASTTYSAGTGNLNYIIPANTTRTLTVSGDLASTATGTLSVTFGGFTSAQSYTTLSAITVGSAGSNLLSVLTSGSNLSASLNFSLGAPVAASANSEVRVASYSLTAGQINAINLTGVTVTTVSNTTVAGYLRNLRVQIGSTQLGSIQPTVASNQAYTFNANGPVAIAANASVSVDVYATLSSSVTATTSVVANLTSVNAQTASGNAVSVTGVTGQTVSFNNGGTITGAIGPGTPSASYLGMGVSGGTVAQYQFTASTAGNASVTQLTIRDTTSTATSTGTSTDASTFINYRLFDGQTQIATASNVAGDIVFNLSGLQVLAGANKTLSLVADTNTYPYASSSGAHAFALRSFMYTNAAGATSSSLTSANIGNVFTVYRTSLNVAQGAAFTAPNSISGGTGQVISQFSFTAGVGFDATVKTVVLSTAGTLISSSTAQVLGLYDASAPSTLLATSTATSTNNFSFTPNASAGWVIPAGQSKTLMVKIYSAPSNIGVVTAGTGSYQALLQSATWTDSVTVTISSLSPTISLPVAGQSVTGLSS